MKRVLFVCLGNICRSPAGEAVFQRLIDEAGLGEQIMVDSAGTAGYHTGEPADRRMIEAGAARGYAVTSIARQVDASRDFTSFDYILAADRSNLEDLRAMAPAGVELEGRLHLVCDFCQRRSESEVPDPYYGGQEGFENVLDLLEDACAGLMTRIRPS